MIYEFAACVVPPYPCVCALSSPVSVGIAVTILTALVLVFAVVFLSNVAVFVTLEYPLPLPDEPVATVAPVPLETNLPVATLTSVNV